MFLKQYLDVVYYNELLDNYHNSYLQSLNQEQFLAIYHLLQENGFYFINDIILYYLELFELPYEIVSQNIAFLKQQLGDNFVHIIGHDMRYFDFILAQSISRARHFRTDLINFYIK